MIPKEKIAEIRSQADIVKIVSEYVQLKQRGKNYLGHCPFHSEKDPSFTVSPEKQIFHCFGCNEGGNVFSFLMKIENLSFIEAVAEVASKVGIALPAMVGRPGQNKGEKDQLFQIMQLAKQFFEQALADKAAQATQEYLEQRGLARPTQAMFGLGFAPAGWDNLLKFLIARGVAPENIAKAGLAIARDQQGGYYDRFRNRLIIPICDQRGRVLAFGGRALTNEEPKYLNSPDSLIYHKGEILFGLNLAKESIKKSRIAIMVEGYFDLLTPFQAGLTNLVATLGTALTTNQCKLLTRYCDNVIVAFDSDTAGSLAAERSVELMRTFELKIKVAILTGGKDPDEIVHQHGVASLKKCLDTALPFLEFKLKRIMARFNLSEIEGRAEALQTIAKYLNQEKDVFIQQEYAKLVADWLKIKPELLQAAIAKLQSYAGQRQGKRQARQTVARPQSKIVEAEKNLIALAVFDPDSRTRLAGSLSADDFSLPETKEIACLLLAKDLTDQAGLAHFLLENLKSEPAKQLLSRLLLSEHLSDLAAKALITEDCIKTLLQQKSSHKITDLKQEIMAAEQNGQAEKVAELLNQLKSEIS
ncbi:DNA primase [Candidatus Saganbacteria bacterium CG08_land_8_20_14_0_20_45_16]|uniref:DNA primase n=1 Tax=Candidatus Saganbacteria bacterium CG08_land_8_20_14_0_20_45_16 TaxID=2014293 RepID=A0A2H0Y138_UNCSA|nr:MAG: DNA primase [Candidatus Saganbacteria bacterium CG08_land_8_20_14_0_20_45_16]